MIQSEKPLFYGLKPQIDKIVTTLCANYMKIEAVRNVDGFNLDHQNPRNLSPLDSIYLGIVASASFESLKTKYLCKTSCNEFLKTISEFFIEFPV